MTTEELTQYYNTHFDYYLLAAESVRTRDSEIAYLLKYQPDVHFRFIESSLDIQKYIAEPKTKTKAVFCGHGWEAVIAGFDYTDLYPLMMQYDEIIIISCMQNRKIITADLMSMLSCQEFKSHTEPPCNKAMFRCLLQQFDFHWPSQTVVFSSDKARSCLAFVSPDAQATALTFLRQVADKVSEQLRTFWSKIKFISNSMLNELLIDGQWYMYSFPPFSQVRMTHGQPHRLDLSEAQFKVLLTQPQQVQAILNKNMAGSKVTVPRLLVSDIFRHYQTFNEPDP